MTFITQQDNTWHLTGNLVVGNITQVLQQAKALVMNTDICLDFAQVKEVDTSTISLILELQRRASKMNVAISLANPSSNLMSLMHLYGVEGFITQK